MFYIAALHVQGEKQTWHRIGAERSLADAPRPFDNEEAARQVADRLSVMHGGEDTFSLGSWQFKVVPAGACAAR